MSQADRRLYATAPAELVPLLAEELRALGAGEIRQGGAGVHFRGDLETAYRACLWSRFATRILLPLTAVPAKDDEELYREVKGIRWERHLHSSGTLAIDVSLSKAAISHSKFAALRVKDAIVDRFREQFGERPSVDTEEPDLRVHVHLRGEQARISIDLAGASLHRRGYRTEGGRAPLKENLAAAILQLAEWPRIAASGGALIDPMCGSGTLLIEAALMAGDIAPGLERHYFGFLRWRGHEPEVWERLLEEARERRAKGLANIPPIHGYDIHAETVEIATANIERARLADFIKVACSGIDRFDPPAGLKPGLLVVNPPYGERLGELDELKSVYAEMGSQFNRRLPGWEVAVFTGNPQLAGYLAMAPAGTPAPLHNGPIECRLFRFKVTEHGVEEAPAVELSEGARAYANRLKKNLAHLRKWARREGVDCYRLYDADLPEYAVAVDLYQGQQTWVHVQEYAPPAKVDPDKAWQRLQEAVAATAQVLELPAAQVFLKVRQRQRGKAQYERQQTDSGRYFEVHEGPCRLLVNFTDYLDTGLFLDHRPTRLMVGRHARGKRFLNLFAYTGAVSVHAAVGGASATTTVDMSNTYLDWARRNMALNGKTGAEHRYVQSDVLRWLDEPGRGREQYDLIFLDPPTFSNSKRMEQVFDVQRDHVAMLAATLRLLAPGGLLVFSNNFQRFRLDQAALEGMGMQVRDITAATTGQDFVRHPLHHCWLIAHGDTERGLLDSFTKL